MKQKHFVDIERVKIPKDDISKNNTFGFEVGDHIVIQEKVDGSNASFRYDVETNSLVAFSRKKILDECNTLNGFFNYVQLLDKDKFKEYPNYVFFGEWLSKHTIPYHQEAYKKFYFYDIFDLNTNQYLTQGRVKLFAQMLGLNYVKTYYDGEFISWEHCKTFMERESDISIGIQEGIVIKNDTKRCIEIFNPNELKYETVLKMVNDRFSEIKINNHIKKELDPQKEQEISHCKEIVDKIVTKQRVRKELLKMIDEGLLPNQLTMKEMGIIAKNLPHRIFLDCVKEEWEYVAEAGTHFGKLSNKAVINFAKEIIIGV